MAIDTARKRAGAASVGRVWRGRAIRPDGTLDQADRQQVGWSYPGILAVTPAVLAVCTASVYVSITPIASVLAAMSPTANISASIAPSASVLAALSPIADVLVNISPTGEVLIDELG